MLADPTKFATGCPAPRPPPPLPSPPVYTPYYCEENAVLLLRSLTARILPPTRSYALFITNTSQAAVLFHQKASKLGPEQGHYVIWDYHVIAVTVEEDESCWAWDQDSRLGMPVGWKVRRARPLMKVKLISCSADYLESTFRPDLFEQGILPPPLASRFRVVPADVLFENFASDRSHMLLPPPLPASHAPSAPQTPALAAQILQSFPTAYIHPPPIYPPLLGADAATRGEANNLFDRFLEVRLIGEDGLDCELEKERYGEVVKGVKELLERKW